MESIDHLKEGASKILITPCPDGLVRLLTAIPTNNVLFVSVRLATSPDKARIDTSGRITVITDSVAGGPEITMPALTVPDSNV